MKMFLGLLAFVLGLYFGWQGAHQQVAAECERLGGFFVGKRIYKCVAVKEHKNEPVQP